MAHPIAIGLLMSDVFQIVNVFKKSGRLIIKAKEIGYLKILPVKGKSDINKSDIRHQ